MPNEGIPQNAAPRPTEGSRPTRAGSGKRGRPKGSKNKPKGILPVELANTILLEMKSMLPPEHYEYMRSVIRDGAAISTDRERDTLILLLGRNLYPALVMEGMGLDQENDEDDFFDDPDAADATPKKPEQKKLKMPVFRKDVTERLKVLQSLLESKEKSERANTEPKDKPLLTIVGQSGIDASRLRVLVGIESRSVVGDADEAEQPANEIRTVSDTLPERPELLPADVEGETNRD